MKASLDASLELPGMHTFPPFIATVHAQMSLSKEAHFIFECGTQHFVSLETNGLKELLIH